MRYSTDLVTTSDTKNVCCFWDLWIFLLRRGFLWKAARGNIKARLSYRFAARHLATKGRVLPSGLRVLGQSPDERQTLGLAVCRRENLRFVRRHTTLANENTKEY